MQIFFFLLLEYNFSLFCVSAHSNVLYQKSWPFIVSHRSWNTFQTFLLADFLSDSVRTFIKFPITERLNSCTAKIVQCMSVSGRLPIMLFECSVCRVAYTTVGVHTVCIVV